LLKSLHRSLECITLAKEFNKLKQLTMKTLTQWQVWVNKGSQPIIMSLPFNNVNNAHEFIWEQIGKRPISISKL